MGVLWDPTLVPFYLNTVFVVLLAGLAGFRAFGPSGGTHRKPGPAQRRSWGSPRHKGEARV